MDRSVTHAADVVEGLADVAVQVPLPIKSAQPFHLPVTVDADSSPPDEVGGKNLAELSSLEDRDVRVRKDGRLGSGAVQHKQWLMRQQEPEVRRRVGECPDPLVHLSPYGSSPPEHCTLSQSHT